RAPRPEGEAVAPVAPAAAVPRPEAAALPEGERKPRKRRRRRHGRPLEGAEGAVANVAPAASKPVAAPKPADDNAGFLTRLGRKIRALVSGS
ncbi:MAG: ATP-dependent RNA helicase RhlB, partial [Pseudoxanthomonas sp.]|uniref:ATP-dependent RNA helicase RhlB n=1 Tax=Pseudoxanthomonas sp. TaxID=1871049 RepID=UPI00258DC5E1